MWHGTTVLLSSLPKTLQAEHIFEISYVQASFLVPVRILLTLCYSDFLLSCMCICFLIFLVTISQFYVLFGLECGDCFERWIGGIRKEEFITLTRTFSCFCLIGQEETTKDIPQDIWILAKESDSDNPSYESEVSSTRLQHYWCKTSVRVWWNINEYYTTVCSTLIFESFMLWRCRLVR